MSCEIVLPCNLGTSELPHCYFCSMRKVHVRSVNCGHFWTTDRPDDSWVGHNVNAWILEHGPAEPQMPGALLLAREFFTRDPGDPALPFYELDDGRGHYTLRDPDGHPYLERFPANKTVPFSLSHAIVNVTDAAIMWFFDTTVTLADPHALRRFSDAEVHERLDWYQHFIDIETRRAGQLLKALPTLRELPEHLGRRLVEHWERLWFDWIDIHHPEWCWLPAYGFWRRSEIIYPLHDGLDPVTMRHGQGKPNLPRQQP